MDRLREVRRVRRRVRVGAPDPSLTLVSGMVAVTELADRLGVIERLDATIGPIKSRRRGLSGGQLLVGMAGAQLAGEEFLVGLDRQRADAAGQLLAPVAGLSSTTAGGLARRFTDGQWVAVETALGDVHTAMLDMLASHDPGRAEALAQAVTIDLDTTDVEVYGRRKRGVAYNYAGRRCGRPHVATWAETATALAADLLAGNEDPRADAPGLLHRALAALPAQARGGQVRLRADGGYFAGALARAALASEVEFAIGAHRIAPLWRTLAGIAETDWAEAIDMPGAQVAVAHYTPGWWPAATRLLIRRVRLDPTTQLSSSVGGWLTAEIAAGRIQRLPVALLLHQLLGPLLLHLLSGSLIARHVGPQNPDLHEACAMFAAAFVQAVGTSEPAMPTRKRRTRPSIETKGDRT